MKLFVTLVCLSLASAGFAIPFGKNRVHSGTAEFKPHACLVLTLEQPLPEAPTQMTVGLAAGVIISNRMILTAGHVVNGVSNFQIGYGSGVARSLVRVTATTGLTVNGFNGDTFENDLGVIVLPAGISLNVNSDRVAVCGLPNIEAGEPAPTGTGTVASFGFSETQTTTINDNMMVAEITLAACTVDAPESHQCGGGAAGALCRGDNGAGLVFMEADAEGVEQPIVYGVASVIPSACAADNESSFQMLSAAHVVQLRDFIGQSAAALAALVA